VISSSLSGYNVKQIITWGKNDDQPGDTFRGNACKTRLCKNCSSTVSTLKITHQSRALRALPGIAQRRSGLPDQLSRKGKRRNFDGPTAQVSFYFRKRQKFVVEPW